MVVLKLTFVLMKTKDISPITYAKWYGCHKSYIHRLLKNKEIEKLPHVIAIKKYSRFYTLKVPHNLTENDFKEYK